MVDLLVAGSPARDGGRRGLVSDAEFEKTFTTPGTYKFICTIHPTQMHMTIVVKK